MFGEREEQCATCILGDSQLSGFNSLLDALEQSRTGHMDTGLSQARVRLARNMQRTPKQDIDPVL